MLIQRAIKLKTLYKQFPFLLHNNIFVEYYDPDQIPEEYRHYPIYCQDDPPDEYDKYPRDLAYQEMQYKGASIPSKSFQFIQATTGTTNTGKAG